jgi:tetratricopeptide (TPR) repeat protein
MAIWIESLGPDHPQVGWALNNLGLVERERGNHEAARDYFQQSVEVAEKAHGPDHADVATQLKNMAVEMHILGDSEAAIPEMERALAIREKVYGSEHSYVGYILLELADIHRAMGHLAEAAPLYGRAAELGRTDPGYRGDEVTTPRILQARCLTELGRTDEAGAVLRAEAGACDEEDRARVEEALAEIGL